MPGLDPTVAVHCLVIKQGVCPIKQAQRCFRPELLPQIEAEVNKLEQAGFIREVQFPSGLQTLSLLKRKMDKFEFVLIFET